MVWGSGAVPALEDRVQHAHYYNHSLSSNHVTVFGALSRPSLRGLSSTGLLLQS